PTPRAPPHRRARPPPPPPRPPPPPPPPTPPPPPPPPPFVQADDAIPDHVEALVGSEMCIRDRSQAAILFTLQQQGFFTEAEEAVLKLSLIHI
ncbi:hypothetical protein ACQ4LK_25040, partial [Bacillus pumilus]